MIIGIRAALIRGGALVTATQIGQATGTISRYRRRASPRRCLSAGLFSGTALTVLPDHSREVPR